MDEVLPEDDVNGCTEVRVGFARREVPEAWAKDRRLAAARTAAPRSTAGESGAFGRREGNPRGVAVGIAQNNVPSKSRRIFGGHRVTGFLDLLQLLRLLVLKVDRLDVTDVDAGEVEGLEDGSTGG